MYIRSFGHITYDGCGRPDEGLQGCLLIVGSGFRRPWLCSVPLVPHKWNHNQNEHSWPSSKYRLMFSYPTTGTISFARLSKIACILTVPTKMIPIKGYLTKFASLLLVFMWKNGSITAVFDLHGFRANLGRNTGLCVVKVDHVSLCSFLLSKSQILKGYYPGARKMAKQLREFVPLEEDPSSAPSTMSSC